MSLIPEGDGPPSSSEVRQVEARVDARFQAVSARFTVVDRRSAGVGERVDGVEHHACEVAERFDRHRKTVDARFDATDARVDLVYEHMAEQLGERFDYVEAHLDLMYDTVLVQVERATRRQGRMLTYAVLAAGAAVVVIEFAGLALQGWLA